MSYPVYYVVEGDTLPHFFDTYAGSTGASVTMSGLAVTDIEIYKDGGPTQRASDAGYTLLDTDGIDFDGITGIHGFSIDLNDNTDAGFYSVGPWYHVVVSAITVDSQTVSFVACAFRIVSATRGLAGTALPAAAADAAGGLIISDAGGLDADAQLVTKINDILTDTGTTLDGRIPAALVGGRMDANVGAISSDATAADNAEAFFDGTGYAGTNNVIPTVTTVTTVTNLTNAPTNGDLTATMKTSVQTSATASIVAFFGANLTAMITSFYAATVSTGLSVLQTFRLIGGSLGGKTSGAGTATITIRNYADTVDALVVGMTGSNRTSFTFDLSA